MRCGAVRCGTGRDGTVRYGTVRYGTVRYGAVRYGMVRYGSVRCGTARNGTARYGALWCGTVNFGTVQYPLDIRCDCGTDAIRVRCWDNFFPNSGYAIRVLIEVKDRIRNRNPPLGLTADVRTSCVLPASGPKMTPLSHFRHVTLKNPSVFYTSEITFSNVFTFWHTFLDRNLKFSNVSAICFTF